MANKNQKNNKSKQTNVKKTNNNKNNDKAKQVNTTKKETAPKKEEKIEKVEKVVEVVEEKKEKTSTPKESTKKETKKEFKLTSKQKDIVLVLLAVVLLVVAFVVTGNKAPKVNIELPVALEGEAGFNEITYSEYVEKMNEEKPFLVIIIKDGCGYCEAYTPIVKEVAEEYNLPIYYINLTNITEEEYTALSKSNSYLKSQQWGTPTTLLMSGNTVVGSISGYVDKDTFVKDMINKYIKVEDNAE